MPKLDTHLHNLIAQWFNAPDQFEKDRLQSEAMRHMQATGRATTAMTAANYWKLLVDLLEA